MLNVNILSFLSRQYLRLIFYLCGEGGIQMEDGYARGGYPIGRVGMLGVSIQEGGDGVGRYPRGKGIQEGALGVLYPRGVAGIQE